jgi:hypothetical protein
MRWAQLKRDDEREAFRSAYEAATGFHAPLEDLRRFRVFAARESGRLLGGFWIIPAPPFRAIQSIPASYSSADPILTGLEDAAIVEVGGLWKSRTIRGAATAAAFFARAGQLALRHIPAGAQLLFGYDHRVAHLRSLYRVGESHILYRGPTSTPGAADDSTIHGTVCLMSRGDFIRGLAGTLGPLATKAVKNSHVWPARFLPGWPSKKAS